MRCPGILTRQSVLISRESQGGGLISVCSTYTSSYRMEKSILCMQDFLYPEGVGLKVGEGSTARYALLEIHYDNPNKREGKFNHYLTTYIILAEYRWKCSAPAST